MATVSSVYAKALFDMARERGQLDSAISEISALVDACRTSPALDAILTGPGFDPGRRQAVLRDILKSMSASPLVSRLMELVVSRGRGAALPEMLRELELMREEAQGVLVGEVRSAVELSGEEVSVLGSALAKRVGSKVKLSQRVDPTLLGGVVATVAGKTFDASLRTQLERFKNELN